jgi:nicotine blue oxidoreductase
VQIVGLVLAAGAGRRMGGPKALLSIDGEQLLVDRAAQVLAACGCWRVVVVLGAAAGEVRRRARLDDATIVVNDAWPEGIGSSLRAGLSQLEDVTAEVVACAVMLVDTPGIGVSAVRRIAAVAREDRAAVATYHGRRGHPVALGRELWAPVARQARGDVGARGFLSSRPDLVVEVPCDDVGVPDDLDTSEALAAHRTREDGDAESD